MKLLAGYATTLLRARHGRAFPAIILLLAFAMGWFTHWLLHRFARVAGSDLAEMDALWNAAKASERIAAQDR